MSKRKRQRNDGFDRKLGAMLGELADSAGGGPTVDATMQALQRRNRRRMVTLAGGSASALLLALTVMIALNRDQPATGLAVSQNVNVTLSALTGDLANASRLVQHLPTPTHAPTPRTHSDDTQGVTSLVAYLDDLGISGDPMLRSEFDAPAASTPSAVNFDSSLKLQFTGAPVGDDQQPNLFNLGAPQRGEQ